MSTHSGSPDCFIFCLQQRCSCRHSVRSKRGHMICMSFCKDMTYPATWLDGVSTTFAKSQTATTLNVFMTRVIHAPPAPPENHLSWRALISSRLFRVPVLSHRYYSSTEGLKCCFLRVQTAAEELLCCCCMTKAQKSPIDAWGVFRVELRQSSSLFLLCFSLSCSQITFRKSTNVVVAKCFQSILILPKAHHYASLDYYHWWINIKDFVIKYHHSCPKVYYWRIL